MEIEPWRTVCIVQFGQAGLYSVMNSRSVRREGEALSSEAGTLDMTGDRNAFILTSFHTNFQQSDVSCYITHLSCSIQSVILGLF